MARIFRGPAGGRKGRAYGKWDAHRQAPPTAHQTVVASYVREGFSKEAAEQEAQKWQKRMDQARIAVASARTPE